MRRHLLAVILAALAVAVPLVAAGDGGVPPPEQGPPTEARDTRININEAGVADLVRLPGIGPSRAQAIIAEREKRRFRRVEDIMRVPGIGRKTFGRIRASIRVR
ncbi:MAG: ComEA family DNA-binding protein [Deltaproteobacteria bacterium]|jgi:competence protein ComEA|nr:ComEA family DNA-binding protein [Deltaproteobacteria bacterium]